MEEITRPPSASALPSASATCSRSWDMTADAATEGSSLAGALKETPASVEISWYLRLLQVSQEVACTARVPEAAAVPAAPVRAVPPVPAAVPAAAPAVAPPAAAAYAALPCAVPALFPPIPTTPACVPAFAAALAAAPTPRDPVPKPARPYTSGLPAVRFRPYPVSVRMRLTMPSSVPRMQTTARGDGSSHASSYARSGRKTR